MSCFGAWRKLFAYLCIFVGAGAMSAAARADDKVTLLTPLTTTVHGQ